MGDSLQPDPDRRRAAQLGSQSEEEEQQDSAGVQLGSQAEEEEQQDPAGVQEKQQPEQVQQAPVQQAVVQREQQQTGKNRRPVCFSLHKYFKTAQEHKAGPPDSSGRQQFFELHRPLQPFEARQPVPPPRPSWKAQAQQQHLALQADVEKAAMAQPQKGQDLQLVPPMPVKKQLGGRPPKPADAPKSQYKNLTGRQRVWAVQECQERLTTPGAKRQKTFEAVAKDLGCSPGTVQGCFKARDYWLEWGQKEGIEGCRKPGSWRKPGEKTSVAKKGSKARGSGSQGREGTWAGLTTLGA